MRCLLTTLAVASIAFAQDSASEAELKLLRSWFRLEDSSYRKEAEAVFRAIAGDDALPERLRVRAEIGLSRVEQAKGERAAARRRLESLLARAAELPELRRVIVERLGPPRWFEAVRIVPRAQAGWFLDLDSGGLTQSRDRGPRGGPEMEGAAFLVPTQLDSSIVGALPQMSTKPWHRLRTDEGNLALVQVLSTSQQTVIRFITRLGGYGDVLPSPRGPFCIGYNSKIEVWWRPDPQYVAYRVQRRRGSEGVWEEAVERAQPPFIDRDVDVGERYGYRIVGVTKNGYEGLPARMQATVRSRGVSSGRIEIKSRNVKCDLLMGDVVSQDWDIWVQNIYPQGAMIRNSFNVTVFPLIRIPGDAEPLSPWDAKVGGSWQLKSGDEFLVALRGGGVARCRVTITPKKKNQHGVIIDYYVYGDADSFPQPPKITTTESDDGVTIEAHVDEPYRLGDVQVTKLIAREGPTTLPFDRKGRAFDEDRAHDDMHEYSVIGMDAHGRRTLPGKAIVVRMPSRTYDGEFKFHFQQGYSFERGKIVPYAECDLYFQAASRQIARMLLAAPRGITHLRTVYGWSARNISEKQIFDRVAGAVPEKLNLALTQVWCNEKTIGENTLILRTRHGGWVKFYIANRQNSGNWIKRTTTIRYVYNPREPVFDSEPDGLSIHNGVKFTGLEKIEARARVMEEWTNDWNKLSRDGAFRRLLESESLTGGHVEDPDERQEVILSEDAYNNLAKARYSFSLGRRDPPGENVPTTVWDVKWRGPNFHVRLSRNDKSTITDIGRLHWVQLRDAAQMLVGDTTSIQVRFGHVYLLRKMSGTDDATPTLIRIVGLEPGKRMQIEWVSLQDGELKHSPGLALNEAERLRFRALLVPLTADEEAQKNAMSGGVAGGRAYRVFWNLQNVRLKAVGRRDIKLAKFMEEFALVSDFRYVLEGDIGTRTLSVLRSGASALTVLDDVCDAASLAWRIDAEGRIHLRPRILTEEENREAEAAGERRRLREIEEQKRKEQEEREAKLAELDDVRQALKRAIAELEKKR